MTTSVLLGATDLKLTDMPMFITAATDIEFIQWYLFPLEGS